MYNNGVPIRLNQIAQYKDRKFDKNGRLLMLSNDQLEKADWALRWIACLTVLYYCQTHVPLTGGDTFIIRHNTGMASQVQWVTL